MSQTAFSDNGVRLHFPNRAFDRTTAARDAQNEGVRLHFPRTRGGWKNAV